MTLGEIIKKNREKKELSQIKVSELIPMNQSNYSKIERDLQEPNIFQLKRIAEILNVSIDHLLGLDSKNEIDLEFGKEVKDLYLKYYKK